MGVTFDAGALIALERRRPRAAKRYAVAVDVDDLERLASFFPGVRVLAI